MGVTLIWPVALTLLAGGIVIMYLLKQHAEEYKVPSLFLWTEMYKNQTADKPWEKLKKNILMVLQIMTIIILVIALMGPYIKVGKGSGSTVMIIIDTSASMDSTYKNSGSRLDNAKKDAENLIKNLPNNTLVSVISSNTEAKVIVSATSDKVAAIAAVKAVHQTDRGGNCEKGVETARALYNAYKDAAVVLFTDTYVGTGTLNASIYDYSGEITNAGISYVFSEDNGDDTFTVAAGIQNYGITDMTVAVDLYEVDDNGKKKMVATKDITIPAGERVQADFSDVTLTTQGIAVGIGAEDDLAGDNIFYSSRNIKKEATILLYSPNGNTFLKKAIDLVDGVKVTSLNTGSGFSGQSGYTLYIFDCVGTLDLKEVPTDGNVMVIGTALGQERYQNGTEQYAKLNGKNDYGTYTVPVNETYTYAAPAESKVLFSTEQGDAAGYIGDIEGRKWCVIGFDFHKTDFPLTVNFPILMYELVKQLTDTCPVDKTNLLAGEEVKISLNGMTDSYVLAPDGKKTKVDTLDRFTDTELLGCYLVKGETAEEDTVFTVNFDATESNVQKMQSDGAENIDIKTGGGAGTLNLRTIIIAIAIILLAVEWIIYIRQ